jgi:hypothetical protein
MFGTIIVQIQVKNWLIVVEGESSTRLETKTSFIFHPASWLIRIGLKYGIETAAISLQKGWQYRITPVRAVQDDSLIFQFCETGNVDAVRELFGRGLASVLDANSSGWRPLNVSGFIALLAVRRFQLSM